MGTTNSPPVQGAYTFATLPTSGASLPGGILPVGFELPTSDLGLCIWNGTGWGAVTPASPAVPNAIFQQRQKRIQAHAAGCIIPAPAWTTSAVVVGQVVTLPSGQLIHYTTAGTPGGSAPVLSKTALAARTITDGTAVAFGTWQQNAVTSNTAAPTVSLNASAAAVGLTETQLRSGTVADSRVTCFGGVVGAAGYQNALAPIGFANGLASIATGNATASGTALGYSSTYVYNTFETNMEFYITDSVVGLTFVGSTSLQMISIDGQQMLAAPQILNGTAGQCLLFDYNGVTKRRLVTVHCNAPTGSNALRGVALTTTGYCEASDTLNDQMLLLGDSVLGTISAPAPQHPLAYVGGLLGRYLGLAGTINCSVGGTGYISAGASNAYNCLGILQNPVNQLIFTTKYQPGHILIAQGYNDIGQGLAAEQAAALLVWQTTRNLFPNAKITITDGFSEATGPSVAAINQAVALQQQFVAWGDSNSRFIQTTSAAAATAWCQGTGSNAGAISAGNSCWVIGTDTIHPTALGCDYYARRLASAITTAWNGNY